VALALSLSIPGTHVRTPVILSDSQFIADASAHKVETGGSVLLGRDGQGLSSRPFAEATRAKIDDDARLLREAEQAAVAVIGSHRLQLAQIVDLLLEHETADGSEVYRIVGKPAPDHRPEQLSIGLHAKAATGQGGPGPIRRSEPRPRRASEEMTS
jgi:hypothetical protein